jgi:hypothetical protein
MSCSWFRTWYFRVWCLWSWTTICLCFRTFNTRYIWFWVWCIRFCWVCTQRSISRSFRFDCLRNWWFWIWFIRFFFVCTRVTSWRWFGIRLTSLTRLRMITSINSSLKRMIEKSYKREIKYTTGFGNPSINFFIRCSNRHLWKVKEIQKWSFLNNTPSAWSRIFDFGYSYQTTLSTNTHEIVTSRFTTNRQTIFHDSIPIKC